MTTVPTWEIVVGLACVLFSGFFSSSETALTALPEVKARHLVEQFPRLGAGLQLWIDRPTRVLTGILIGNNVVNIAASSLATDIAARFFPERGVPIAIGVTTLLILIFGEVVPKSAVRARPERYAMVAMLALRVIYYAIYPLIAMFYQITRLSLRLLGGSLRPDGPIVTEAEIEHMVRVGEEEGEIQEHEREMIFNVLELGDTRVREIMIPRTDMVAIELHTTCEEARRVAVDCGHSRLPVYREHIDDIVGVLYSKDLLAALGREGAEITGFLRPANFVPETKRLSDLLRAFQDNRVHLAIVVDEHGGTNGLVTLEDVLEELVGDIQDEHDDEDDRLVVRQRDGGLEVAARVHLDDLGEDLGVVFPEDRDYDTLGGFITDRCGCVPEAGQSLEWNDLRFEVLDAGPVRVERVAIHSFSEEEEEEEGG